MRKHFKILSLLILISFLFSACGNGNSDNKKIVLENAFGDDSRWFQPNDSTLFLPLDSSRTGINFMNAFDEDVKYNFWAFRYTINGAGVCIGDINNDGLVDVFFTANKNPNKLYLNQGGLKFTDISESSGIAKNEAFNSGATMVDINNDGWLDIYISKAGPFPAEKRKNELWINDGKLHFTEQAKSYGLDDTGYTTQSNFFDFDKDGDLDVYVVNYPNEFNERFLNNYYEFIEKGENQSHHFYRNDNGHFVECHKEVGINNHAYGLNALVDDFNNDTWPDVMVCNDFFMTDEVYLNNQDGTFTQSIDKVFRKTSASSMGCDIEDINNDGFSDIIVADLRGENNYYRKTVAAGMDFRSFNTTARSGFFYQYPKNTLQLNNGDGTYSEIAQLAGVSQSYWSWAALLADFDNDGWKDMFIANGFYNFPHMDYRDQYKMLNQCARKNDADEYCRIRKSTPMKSLKYPNYFFKNNGDLTFTKMLPKWASDSFPTQSYGAAYGDLDNDGDLDMIVNNTNQLSFIYENRADKLLPNNRWLKIKLLSSGDNKLAIGAKIFVNLPDGSLQTRNNVITKGYLSSSDPAQHFGLGKNELADVVVKWPDGRVSRRNKVSANQLIVISDDSAKQEVEKPLNRNYLFSQIEDALGIDFKDKQSEYEDFEDQSLMYHQLSKLGPALAKADVNGDGREDVYVAGAGGSHGDLFIQNAAGRFDRSLNQPWSKNSSSEESAICFFDADKDGDADMYVATGSNEYSSSSKNQLDKFYLNDGKGRFSLANDRIPAFYQAAGCVIAGDIDKDGDLDLFVGGRVIPNDYPAPAASFLLLNDGKGKFTDGTAKWAPSFSKLGLVSSALFVDYDKDSDLDLMVCGEWMCIRVFANEGNTLRDRTEDMKLGKTCGWWSSLQPGDFDKDGDIDFIAGNIGHNTNFKTTAKFPVEVFYKDFDKNGKKDVILTIWLFGVRYPLQTFDRLGEAMPAWYKTIKSYDQFAKMGFDTMFSAFGDYKDALHYKADLFSSVYLENKGDSFTVKPLPLIAQFGPLFGTVVHDFDGDGNLDVLAHGNQWSVNSIIFRYDAGTGVFLKGDGKGGFTPQRFMQCGFRSNKDAKAMLMVKVGNRNVVVCSNTNDKVEAFSVNK